MAGKGERKGKREKKKNKEEEDVVSRVVEKENSREGEIGLGLTLKMMKGKEEERMKELERCEDGCLGRYDR